MGLPEPGVYQRDKIHALRSPWSDTTNDDPVGLRRQALGNLWRFVMGLRACSNTSSLGIQHSSLSFPNFHVQLLNVGGFVNVLCLFYCFSFRRQLHPLIAVMAHIDPLILKVAVALLTAQLCPHDTKGYVPALSELVCWSLVLACLAALHWFHNDILEDVKTLLINQTPLIWWTTAASIAATTLAFSFEDSTWIYVSI